MMVSFPMGRMRREENTFVEFSFVNCVLFFFVPVFDLNDSMREGGGSSFPGFSSGSLLTWSFTCAVSIFRHLETSTVY